MPAFRACWRPRGCCAGPLKGIDRKSLSVMVARALARASSECGGARTGSRLPRINARAPSSRARALEAHRCALGLFRDGGPIFYVGGGVAEALPCRDSYAAGQELQQDQVAVAGGGELVEI